MPRPFSEAIRVHRLRIRHPAQAGGGDPRQATARLRQQIEWSDWPEAPDESWVFIRRVHAQAPAERLAAELARAVRTLVRSGKGEEVVRFASFGELLAALLIDLAQGPGAYRWYWQRWSHLFRQAPAQAIPATLSEHLEHLPAVCAHLARQQMLGQIWLRLDPAAATRLIAELSWRHGIAPSALAAERLPAQATDDTGPAPLQLSHALRQRWLPVLSQLSASDARRQLALLLIGQEAAPLMLHQAPALLLARLALTLGLAPAAISARHQAAAAAPRKESATPAQPAAAPDSPAPGPAADVQSESNPAATGLPPDRKSGRVQAAAPESGASMHATPDRPVAPQTEGDAATGSSPAGTTDRKEPAPSREDTAPHGGETAAPADTSQPPFHVTAAAPDTAFDHLHTRQGGLLYLLNLLNRREAQALMAQHWDQMPSGWGWLYRLGEELQLDAADPLTAFIARQLGFDQASELAGLPPLPAREQLLTLAQRWYGRTELWTPRLLQLDARLQATPSHLDMYAAMGSVQLPVRLAGLDVNPGWLPWLGRVVNFHYG